MPKALTNGIQIYYEVHGEGFPLILSWGVGGNSDLWQDQVADLSADYRLILWDARGHGKSETPRQRDQYGIPISADDLLGLMDHLGVEKAYVGGHSLGAGVATVFTLEHPERVEALLIMNSATASGRPVRPELKVAWERQIELALTVGMEPVVEEVVSHPDVWVTAKLDPVGIRGMKAAYLALDPVGYAYSVLSIMDNEHTTDRLKDIRVPTLVLTAEHDPALPLARITADEIPDSRLVVMDGAGHLANLDDPPAFNRHVLDFLGEVDRRRNLGTMRAGTG